jgi:twinkle protein
VGRFVGHEPCPACPSSDGLARYDNGTATCFVCGYFDKGDGVPGEREVEIEPANVKAFAPLDGELESLPVRHISRETCSHFGYRTGFMADGTPCQIAPYYDAKGKLVAQKLRTKTTKGLWLGDAKKAALFGQQRASVEMGSKVYVTEGEIDALSLSQVLGNKWPVVSVKNGATGARKDLEAQLDWLDTFHTVVLVFDADEPGEKAALACAELLPHKARIARLPRKDANEMLVAGETAELLEAVNNAAPFRPDGIRATIELLDEILVPKTMGLPYPWKGLSEKLYGMRRGELLTWCAGTGSGKTQILREIVRQLIVEHGERVGVISLEESNSDTGLGLISLELNTPLHLPDRRIEVTDDQIKAAAQRVLLGKDGQPAHYCYDHWGSVEAATILPKVRYLAHACKVTRVVIDHISIMVSGMATDGDERKRLDEIVTKLGALARELNIGIDLVSHLRRTNGVPFEEGGKISLADLRGTTAIAGVSNAVIALERNQQDPDLKRANTTTLRVLKNRYAGRNGIAGYLFFDEKTGRMVETEAPAESSPTTGGGAGVDPVSGVEAREF